MLKGIEKDERTTFIENKSYKYGCFIFNFGLLIDIIYRSIRLNESSWDLFGLLFLSGFVMTVYQYKQKLFTENRGKNYLLLIIITVVLSAAFAIIYNLLL